MSEPLEDQLAAAGQQITTLQAELAARDELLAEASANVTAAQLERDSAIADRDTARAERDELQAAAAEVAALRESVEAQRAEVEQARQQVESDRQNLNQLVQTEAARIVAATGTTEPVPVTPKGPGDEPKVMTRASFNQLNVAQQNAFMRSGGKLTD